MAARGPTGGGAGGPGGEGAPWSPRKRKVKKTDMYTMIGTTADYQGAMTDKDRRELACEKVCPLRAPPPPPPPPRPSPAAPPGTARVHCC